MPDLYFQKFLKIFEKFEFGDPTLAKAI